MSYDVESRVVQMTFDNKEFEKDARETIKTLDKLNESLQFEGASKGFDAMDKAAKKIDFSGLADSVEKISEKFTLLGTIQRKVFDDIATRVVGLEHKFEALVKSMSIDQITAGWDKYAEKTTAVQTIMGATANEVEDVGDRMKYVNEQLKMLNWFTDETSYNYLDMVNNIGKFTANQVPLEKAVTAMQGIATWAAKSGANVGEASRAMYNLSQAISSGALKLMDWKSIELANMATAEFKQTAIETAEEMGTLRRVGDDVWQTVKGTTVSVKQFRDTLSEGWLSSDVLLETLNKYGSFTKKLNEAYEETGLLTSELLDATEQYAAGNKDLSKWLSRSEVSAEELDRIIAELADDHYDFGRQAFQAAQEAKTFAEAISSVKDAVSTGWMNTFEIIFGDYQEAKVLWTNFANWAWDVFNGGAERRNAIVQAWKDFGGREALFGGEDTVGLLQAMLHTFEDLIEPAKRAWEEVFPTRKIKDIGKSLAETTIRLKNLFENMKLSPEASAGMQKVLMPFMQILKGIGTFAEYAGKTIVILIALLGQAVNTFFEFIGKTDLSTESLKKWATQGNIAAKIFSALAIAASLPVAAIGAIATGLRKLINYCKKSPTVQAFAKALQNVGGAIGGKTVALFYTFCEYLAKLYHLAEPFIPTSEQIAKVIDKVKDAFKNLPQSIINAINAFSEFIRSENKLERIRETISNFAPTFQRFGINIAQGLVAGVKSGMDLVVNAAINLWNNFKTAFMNVAGIASPSVVMQALGAFITAGLVLGITGYMAQLHEAGFSIFDAILNGLADAGYSSEDEAVRIITTLGKGFEYLQVILTPVNNFLSRFFENLSAGQIVLLAFAVGLLNLIKNFNKVSSYIGQSVVKTTDAFTEQVKTVTGIFSALKTGITNSFEQIATGINRFFKSVSGSFRADTLLKNAAGIAILTASILAMYYTFKTVDWNALIVAGGAFVVFTGLLLASVAAINAMGKSIGAAGGFGKMALALGMLSVVATSMAGVIAIFSMLLSQNPWGVIGAMGLLWTEMFGFVLACAAMEKWAKDGIKGVMSIIGFAFALRTMAKAFALIAEPLKDVQDIGPILKAFWSVLFASVIAMTAMQGVKPGAAAGFIATMTSMLIAFSLLKQISEYTKDLTVEKVWMDLVKIVPYIIELGMLTALAASALRFAGDGLKHAGIGLAGAMISFVVAWSLFNTVKKNIEDSGFFDFLKEIYPKLMFFVIIIGVISGIIGLLRGLAIKSEKLSVQLGKGRGFFSGFTGFGLGLISLVGALKLMEYLDVQKIATSIKSLMGIMLPFAAAVAIAGIGKNTAANIRQMTMAVIAMTACIAFMSLFVQEGREGAIIAPALGLAAGLAAFGVALWGASKLTYKVETGPLLMMMIEAVAIAAAMYTLAQYDWKNVASAAGGMSMCLITLGAAMQMWANEKAPSLGALLSSVVIMAAIAGSLWFLQQGVYDWSGMLASGAAMSMVLLSLGHALQEVGLLSDGMTKGALAMVIASASCAAIAGSLWFLREMDWETILAGGVAFSAVVLSLAGALMIASIAGDTLIKGAAALDLASVSLAPAAISLSILSQYAWDGIIQAALALGICVDLLSLALIAPGLIGGNVVLGAAALLLASLSLIPAAFALSMIAEYDWKNIAQATKDLLITLGVVSLIAGVLGAIALTGVGTAALVAGAIAIAVLGAALSAFVAPVAEFVGAVGQLDVSVNNFVSSIGKLISIDQTQVQNAVNSIGNLSSELVKATDKMRNELAAAMFSVGTYAGLSLVSGLSDESMSASVYSAAYKLGANVESGVRDATDVHSLSPLFKMIMRFVGKSMATELVDSSLQSAVYDSAETLGSNAASGAASNANLNAAESAGASLGNRIWQGLQGVWTNIKTWWDTLFHGNNALSGNSIMQSIDTTITTASNTLTGSNNPFSKIKDILRDPKNAIDEFYNSVTGGVLDPNYNPLGNTDGVEDKWEKELGDIASGLNDVGAAGGGAGKSVGEGSKEAEESLEDLLDVTKYASEACTYFKNQYDAQAESLLDISPWSKAIEATEDLVFAYADLTGAIDADAEDITSFADMNEDQAKRVRDAWTDAFDSIRSNISQGFGSVFTSPSFAQGSLELDNILGFSDMQQNLQSQINQMTYFKNVMTKLIAEGLNEDYVQELLSAGPENLSQIVAWDQLTADEVNKINQMYQKLNDTADTLTMDIIKQQAETWSGDSGLVSTLANTITEQVASQDYSALQNRVNEQTTKLLQQVLDADTNWEDFNGTRLGELLDEGIASGIDNMTDIATNACQKLGQEMMASMMKGLKQEAQAAGALSAWNEHVLNGGSESSMYDWYNEQNKLLQASVYSSMQSIPTSYYSGTNKVYDRIFDIADRVKEISEATEEQKASFDDQAKVLLGAWSYINGGSNYDPMIRNAVEKAAAEGNILGQIRGLINSTGDSEWNRSGKSAQYMQFLQEISANSGASYIDGGRYAGSLSGDWKSGYQINLNYEVNQNFDSTGDGYLDAFVGEKAAGGLFMDAIQDALHKSN